jgi:hypothetical protein
VKCKAVLLAVVLIILMATPALAEWSGTVIVDKEYSPEQTKTIYTLVLDYSIRDWWYLDFVLDHHPAKGTDADISTTFYANVFPNTIYVTVGVRGSVWRSDTPVTAYWRLAFKF